HGALKVSVGQVDIHPLSLAVREETGFSIDGQPVRVIRSTDPTRTRWLPGGAAVDVEFIAKDVPAFGWRRYALTPSPTVDDQTDDGRTIDNGEVAVQIATDGTFAVRLGGHEYRGLLAIQDEGDRGDTYDFDAVTHDTATPLVSLTWRRLRHPAGMQRLHV